MQFMREPLSVVGPLGRSLLDRGLRLGDFMETPVRLGDLDSLLFFFWTPCPHS